VCMLRSVGLTRARIITFTTGEKFCTPANRDFRHGRSQYGIVLRRQNNMKFRIAVFNVYK